MWLREAATVMTDPVKRAVKRAKRAEESKPGRRLQNTKDQDQASED